jgi:hypothetical protein
MGYPEYRHFDGVYPEHLGSAEGLSVTVFSFLLTTDD